MLHYNSAVPWNGAKQFSNLELQKGAVLFWSFPYPTPAFPKLRALGCVHSVHQMSDKISIASLIFNHFHPGVSWDYISSCKNNHVASTNTKELGYVTIYISFSPVLVCSVETMVTNPTFFWCCNKYLWLTACSLYYPFWWENWNLSASLFFWWFLVCFGLFWCGLVWFLSGSSVHCSCFMTFLFVLFWKARRHYGSALCSIGNTKEHHIFLVNTFSCLN